MKKLPFVLIMLFIPLSLALASTVIDGITWGSKTPPINQSSACPPGSVMVHAWATDDKSRIGIVSKFCQDISATPGLVWGSKTPPINQSSACPPGSVMVHAWKTDDGSRIGIVSKFCQYISITPSRPPPPTNPTKPTVADVAMCIVGNAQSYTITSTDSDNSAKLRYGIDWNMDGTVDEWVPASGYVPKGRWSQTASHDWGNTPGPHTFQVMAEDSNGNTSQP